MLGAFYTTSDSPAIGVFPGRALTNANIDSTGKAIMTTMPTV
tara:strand:+ start:1890 stop:2015 length:126 start_codon:yes stop_codon:yes gene_type:complete